MTLTLSDFCTRNVIWHPPTGVGFIDVEQSYWSYPVLSLWHFIMTVDDAKGRDLRDQIGETFTQVWSDTIDPKTMRRLLARLPLLGELFAILLASRGLDDRAEALGSDLPPGYRARQLAPRVRRLFETVPVHAT